MSGTIERQSNIEILRIVAMILIIFHHMSLHGGLIDDCCGKNYYLAAILVQGGKLGVDIFVLISGYFLWEKGFNVKRIAKLEWKVFTYSILAFVLALLINADTICFSSIIHTVFPTLSWRWWFMSSFIALMLIFPALNIIVNKVEKRKFLVIILIGLFFTCIVPTILKFGSILDGNISWFVVLYLCGAYIGKYQPHYKKWKIITIAICSYGITYIMNIAIHFYASAGGTGYYFDYCSWNMNSAFIFITAVASLLLFKEIDLGSIKSINILASVMFDIYIIHDSPYRDVLWNRILHTSSYANNPNLMIYCLLWFMIIFIGCSVAGLIIDRTIHRPLYKTKTFNKLCGRVEKCF